MNMWAGLVTCRCQEEGILKHAADILLRSVNGSEANLRILGGHSHE
jgi:hypothetical protein